LPMGSETARAIETAAIAVVTMRRLIPSSAPGPHGPVGAKRRGLYWGSPRPFPSDLCPAPTHEACDGGAGKGLRGRRLQGRAEGGRSPSMKTRTALADGALDQSPESGSSM
jgi:hypothetical protein